MLIPTDKRLEHLAALDETNNRALARLTQAVAAKLRRRGMGEAEIQAFVARVTTRQNNANAAEHHPRV